MSYTVNKSNGDIASVVNDFRKEIIGGLNILGYGYVNFGEDVAENFVKVAENFRSKTPPYAYVQGQLWLDIETTRSPVPVLRIAVRDASSLDEINFTQVYVAADWVGLFSIDATNNQAGIFYNGQPTYPDVNPVAGTLVVRASDGKIPANNLPDSVTSGNATTAQRLTPGANINGNLFTGQNDITINTGQIPESGNLYYSDARARAALHPGRYIAIDSDGTVRFTGPDPSSGADGRGVAGASVNDGGHLIVSYSDGQQQDAGYVVGPQGPQGAQGPQGPQGPQGAQGPAGSSADVITAASYNPNGGYVVYNGGFCVQWGRVRTYFNREQAVNVTFPIAYVAPPYVIQATTYLGYFRNRADLWPMRTGEGNTTGFTITLESSTDNDQNCDGFDWIAYGQINPSYASGGGGGGNPGGGGGDGGGGGGGCVWWGAYLQNDEQVMAAQAGDPLWILDKDGNNFHDGQIESLRYMIQPCWTIQTQSGIELTASNSTPITLRDGSSINITKVLGHEVPVWDEADGFRWELVTKIFEVGDMKVALLNAGNNTFAAGNVPGRLIFTHNLIDNKEIL